MRGLTRAGALLPLVCILAGIVVSPASAQERPVDSQEKSDPRLPTASVGPVSFIVDSGVFYTAEGFPLVEVYLQAPFDQLSFTQEGGGFVSRVEVVVVFQDISGDQVGGDSWSREIWVEDYDESIDPESTYRAQAKFSLPPGEYSLKLTCGGLGSDLTGEVYRHIEVAPPGEGLALSDIRLGACGGDSSAGSTVMVSSDSAGAVESPFVPNAARRFGAESGLVCAIAEVYDFADSGVDTLAVNVSVVDEKKEHVWEERRAVPSAGAMTRLAFAVPMDSLVWGVYSMGLKVRAGEVEARSSRLFEVDESKVAMTLDLEQLTDLVALFATEEELETLATMPANEREAYLDEIWRKRDPDPSTPRNEFKIRFFRRLKEAKTRFKEPHAEGWQTDRGKVYIRKGPPDRVEVRGVPGSMSPYAVYEIWYYDATGARYVFEDYSGTGSYTLVDVSES